MAKTKRGSLRKSFLLLTIIPLVALGTIITIFSAYRFKETIYEEKADDLKNAAMIIANVIDREFPGDLSLDKSNNLVALKKGEEYLGDNVDILNSIKEDTGLDVSIFYGDTRFISTLSATYGDEVLGKTVSYGIKKTVIEDNQILFLKDAYINDTKMVAYYVPIHNADGSSAGMIGVVKEASEVDKSVRQSITPIIIIVWVVTILAAGITVYYSQTIVKAFRKIKKFLMAAERGELDRHIPESIVKRDDELGEMAHAAESMQHSLRTMIEQDPLTKLLNRRRANQKLMKAFKQMDDEGGVLSVSIGDIDFFKKFNDTYGHEAGDMVLIAVADTMRSHMKGKGFVSRWGGEEFMIVFESLDEAAAEAELNSLLDKVHGISVEYNDQILKVNMSFGVYCPEPLPKRKKNDNQTDDERYKPHIENALNTADDCLYYAKEHGRNQVVAHSNVSVEE